MSAAVAGPRHGLSSGHSASVAACRSMAKSPPRSSAPIAAEMELHFSSARAAVVASGVVLEVIHRYKYQPSAVVRAVPGGLAGARSRRRCWHGQRPGLIVPVPLHPTKKREREFNQAERLASHLGDAMQHPREPRLLRACRAHPHPDPAAPAAAPGQHAQRLRDARRRAA